MKKGILLSAFVAVVSLFGLVVAEQGDFATLGYNSPSGYSYWRVDSSGYFKPGYDNSYDIGTAALRVRNIYVGTGIVGGTYTSSTLTSPTIAGPTITGNATFSGNIYKGAATYVSTFTASSGAQAWTGALTMNGGFTGTTGALTSTLDVDGNVTLGAAGYISTMTAASGAWAITGAVTSLSSITGTSLSASSSFIQLYSRSKAQILALTPTAAGQAYYCSDCTAVTICVSTGTGAGAFTKVTDRAAACD